MGFTLVAESGGHSLPAVPRLHVATASLVGEHGSRAGGLSTCSSRALELKGCGTWKTHAGTLNLLKDQMFSLFIQAHMGSAAYGSDLFKKQKLKTALLSASLGQGCEVAQGNLVN